MGEEKRERAALSRESRQAIMADKYVMGKKGERRMKDVEVCLPICVGTVSFWLGKRADEYHSHKWTVYVRSPVNEDLSPVVKKVVFHLHHSFAAPVREVQQQPFELTETGWGEFEITAVVHFVDEAKEEPFQMVHGLKLFHTNEQPLSTKKPVVSEHYEELVFSEPTEALYTKVVPIVSKPAPSSPLTPHFHQHSDAEEFAKISKARERIANLVPSIKQTKDGGEPAAGQTQVKMEA